MIRILLRLFIFIIAVSTQFAHAQSQSLDFDATAFRSPTTSCGLITLERPSIGTHLHPRALLNLSYAYQPLVLNGYQLERAFIDNRFEGSANLSLGFFNLFEVGLRLPIRFYQNGESLDVSEGIVKTPYLAKGGIGDLAASLKLRLLGHQLSGFSAGLLALVEIPNAQSDSVSGPNLGFEAKLLLGYVIGDLGITLNGGYHLRKNEVFYDLVLGDEILYAAGVDYRLAKGLELIVEATGKTYAAKPLKSRYQSPMMVYGGVRKRLGDFLVALSGGSGVIAGYGAPKAEFIVGLGYVPGGSDADGDRISDHHDQCPLKAEDRDGFEDSDGCPDLDNDKDGIADSVDKCPLDAEDIDGFEDTDGCPDVDNDGDGILDKDDECPNEKEDKDGFKDADGCPDLDNDGDGIPDKVDKCPNKAEILNGIADEDGCPEADRDADGIMDDKDSCPDQPEDKNGLEDDDGCPEDPDGDGIPNRKDRCPMEKETVNGYQDEDGCPDDPTPKVEIKRSEIVTSESLYFKSDSWDLNAASRRMLRLMAQVILKDKRVKMIYVEGHADQRGTEKYNQWLSYKRALNVVRYLRKQGVKRTKIRALGWGQQRPWDSSETDKGMARNRRVHFHVERKARRMKIKWAPKKVKQAAKKKSKHSTTKAVKK